MNRLKTAYILKSSYIRAIIVLGSLIGMALAAGAADQFPI